jgi:hypothetical protein
MKAFLTGVVLTIAIAVVAAVGLQFASQSAQQVYTQHSNVRL